MMRGRREMAVAVRAPDGGIRVYQEPLTSWVYRSKMMKWPFLRGIVLLWDALLLGTRALVFAANVALARGGRRRPPSPSRRMSRPPSCRTRRRSAARRKPKGRPN